MAQSQRCAVLRRGLCYKEDADVGICKCAEDSLVYTYYTHHAESLDCEQVGVIDA